MYQKYSHLQYPFRFNYNQMSFLNSNYTPKYISHHLWTLGQ